MVNGSDAASTSCWAVDVTQYREEASLLEGTRKCACVRQVRQSNIAVTLEPEMKEIEILCYDGMRRPREVQRE